MFDVAGNYSTGEFKSRISNGILFEEPLAHRDILTDCDRLNLLEPRDLRYGRDLLKLSDSLDRLNLLYGRNLLDVSNSDRLYLSDLLDSDLTDLSERLDNRPGIGLLDFLDFLDDRDRLGQSDESARLCPSLWPRNRTGDPGLGRGALFHADGRGGAGGKFLRHTTGDPVGICDWRLWRAGPEPGLGY